MQGASWSSMDFGGNWRLLHYTMKKLYAPFTVIVEQDKLNGPYTIWAVTDLNKEIQGGCCDLWIFTGIKGSPLLIQLSQSQLPNKC